MADLYEIVLNAMKEIEGVLSSDNALKVQEEALLNAVNESEKSRHYFEKRYQRGLDTMQSLLMAQEQEISIKQSLIAIRSARLSNRIDLAIATGLSVY